MLDVVLLASGLLALVVGALFAHLERWSISPSLLGLTTGVLLGPQVTGAISLPPADRVAVLAVAAELLLAVGLMGIALRYPLAAVRARLAEVGLLVVVVMPVMAAVVAAGAAWTLQLPVALALVLGATLAPTDPVLVSGVATGAVAERDIADRSREALSLESGANDGLAQPLVVLAVAVALGHAVPAELGRAGYEVGAAAVLGALAGTSSGWVLRWAERHREVGPAVRSLYTLVLAAFVLGASNLLGIAGLLTVFVAGLAHNRVVTAGDRESEVAVDEALNQFLVIPVFLLLGAALPWSGWAQLGWGGIGFVSICLILRRLPIVLALELPLRAAWAHALWLGWFGPIGAAALFYLGHVDERGVTDPRLWAAGTLVVAVSTVVHGLSAGLGRVAYRRAGIRRGRPGRGQHDPRRAASRS